MSKNLKIIQTISLVAKIVCQVLMVLSIVAAAVCAVGIVCYAAGLNDAINWGKVNIHGLIGNHTDLVAGQIYASLCDGIIMGAASAVVFAFVVKYCKNELKAGTPFTETGAKEMFRLGVITIAVILGGKIISGIMGGIICAVMDCKYSALTGTDISFTTGLLFMLLSVVFSYGVEISNNKPATENAPAASDTEDKPAAENAPVSSEAEDSDAL